MAPALSYTLNVAVGISAGIGALTSALPFAQPYTLPLCLAMLVLITGANAEWWQHVPTGGTVTIRDARVELPYLHCTRNETIQGGPSVKLESYKSEAPFNVPAATLDAATCTSTGEPGTSGKLGVSTTSTWGKTGLIVARSRTGWVTWRSPILARL